MNWRAVSVTGCCVETSAAPAAIPSATRAPTTIWRIMGSFSWYGGRLLGQRTERHHGSVGLGNVSGGQAFGARVTGGIALDHDLHARGNGVFLPTLSSQGRHTAPRGNTPLGFLTVGLGHLHDHVGVRVDEPDGLDDP